MIHLMRQGKNIFRPIAFAISALCIVLTMFDCPRHSELFSYFTIQSNVMCLILMFWKLRKEPPAIFRGLATVCITLTFLVYHIMLRPAGFTIANMGNLKNISNLFAHYLVPACVWIDYLLFTPKGSMKVYYPLAWICYPLLRAQQCSLFLPGHRSSGNRRSISLVCCQSCSNPSPLLSVFTSG